MKCWETTCEQAREKFMSLKKGTRAEVVSELEEVILSFSDNMTSALIEFLFNQPHKPNSALCSSWQDLHNSKSAFERCRFNLVCVIYFLPYQANSLFHPFQLCSMGLRNSGKCACKYWSKEEIRVFGIYKCNNGCSYEIF